MRGTSLGVLSAGRTPLMMIGCFAYGGGPVDCSDWPCVDCAVDFSPGGVWIGYIRQVLWDRSLTDAAPVTGSLVFSALFDCLDIYCAAGFTSCRTFCSTVCVLLVGFGLSLRRVSEYWTMATDGAALVEHRAGITFGVELYVPWDAPEAVVDISSEGVVPLRSIPDVIGLTGRRADVVECRVLQGRDVCSVRVLVPDPRGMDQNFHDVTIVDMGDVPESSVSIPDMSSLSQQWPPAVISHMGWRQQELEGICVRQPSSVSVRVDRVVVCTVAYGLSATCIGMWRGSIWTWRNCGGAQCRGAPCGRTRTRTVWITFGGCMMFRGKLSRPAFFCRGLLHVRCGWTP